MPMLANGVGGFWQGFLRFCSEYGNAASVIGLAITLVGFILILRGQWKLKRSVSEALEKVGSQLF